MREELTLATIVRVMLTHIECKEHMCLPLQSMREIYSERMKNETSTTQRKKK